MPARRGGFPPPYIGGSSSRTWTGLISPRNSIQPGLGLHVRTVSETTQRGATRPRRRSCCDSISAAGSWTRWGARQFELWDCLAKEVEGFFVEFRPYVALCAFPDCTHTHEERCAVKDAVALRRISEQRYFSYLGLREGRTE